MKLAAPEIVTYSRGASKSLEYEVDQTAKVMNMFSDLLYGDKIGAPIRELSTNAWDSHIMAGNTDKVPYVHLPTVAEPEFSIRDFGTGMSPDDLENMYRRYGSSNKTSSDLLNGCMGIGSKSPFAYKGSNSFTTVSYYNGVKYIYVNSKGANGKPCLKPMGESPTDEPNGVKVSFAVKKDDIPEFRDKAEDILQWFPKVFDCNLELDIAERKYSKLSDDGTWGIRSDLSYIHESYVIMGNVRYPIEPKHFRNEIEESDEDNSWYARQHREKKRANIYTTALGSSIELNLSIGEVEMASSRESLQYTAKTIAKIKEKIDTIVESLCESLKEDVKNCDSLYDACLKWQESILNNFRGFEKLVSGQVKWKGKDVEKVVIVLKDKLRSDDAIGKIVSFSKDNYRKSPRRTNDVYDIFVRKDVAFYVADMKTGNYSSLLRSLESDGVESASRVYLIKDTSDDFLSEFCNQAGILKSRIKKCSDLPAAPKTKRGKVPQNKVYLLNKNGSWDNESVTFDDGGLYIEINNWKGKLPNSQSLWLHQRDIAMIRRYLTNLGISVPNIYGVKSAAIKKFNSSNKWDNFCVWAKNKIDEYVKSNDLSEAVAATNAISDFTEESLCRKLIQNRKKLKKDDSVLGKFLDKASCADTIRDTYSEKLENISRAFSILRYDNITVTPKVQFNLNEDFALVLAKYGVLQLVSYWDLSYDKRCKIVFDTINMIDSLDDNNNSKEN